MIVARATPSPLGPFAMFSRLVGLGAKTRLPEVLRKPAYRAFARAVGANLGEAELELQQYSSLGDLFARKLRPGARPIDSDPSALIAPCDGVIAARGDAAGGQLIQAKGLHYRLEDLVVDREYARRLIGGPYATIYLSPRDYHRVHAPLDARLIAYDYVPGEMWPVNPRVAARRPELLTRNERVVIWLDAPSVGIIALVMVAAAGVGNIALAHADNIAASGELSRVTLDEAVCRGDELGVFQLGSTVVMIFPQGSVLLSGNTGDVTRFGQRIGSLGAQA